MATYLRAAPENPGQTAKDFLLNIDNDLLACRGQGHAWPKLKPSKRPKRGIRAVPQRDGCYQLTTTCRDCGMERVLTTLPGGAIDHPARYTYRAPEGYRAPKGPDHPAGLPG